MANNENVKEETGTLVIEMPLEGFGEQAFENLGRIIENKGELIKKAFGIDTLEIERKEDRICFPWFLVSSDSVMNRACTHFVASLCEMAKTQKRVSISKKDLENEKYAFRCFLLRLGFIGDEYKDERKILLSRLSGNSAFKSLVGKDEENE